MYGNDRQPVPHIAATQGTLMLTASPINGWRHFQFHGKNEFVRTPDGARRNRNDPHEKVPDHR
jgi:hypothetical protein